MLAVVVVLVAGVGWEVGVLHFNDVYEYTFEFNSGVRRRFLLGKACVLRGTANL